MNHGKVDRPCNRSIRRTLELTVQMLEVADEGDRNREDTGCGILYAVLRDAAYKIRALAEKERAAHIRKGWWTEAHQNPKEEEE